MRDAAHHRPKDALSPGFKKYAGLLTEYEKRERQPGEAMPPANDLFARPVYVPERDNRDTRRKSL